MNGLLIATMLMSGGSAAAMQNQEVNIAVNETANRVMTQVKSMFKGKRIENLKENGYIYPSEEFLSTLTEDQSFQITSAIDVINATYDFANMSDEEIEDALVLIRAEMHDLYTELGIEGPEVKTQTRTRAGSRKGKNRDSDFVPGSRNNLNPPCEDEIVETEDLV